MKFGKSLDENALPQYRGHYLNYKMLKTILKKTTGGDSSEEFLRVLNIEKERLNSFVNGEIQAWTRRLEQLQASLSSTKEIAPLEELQQQIGDLQHVIIQLEEFVTLNYTGFGKILKKHDKVTGKKIRDDYLSGLEESSFYATFDANQLLELVTKTNDQVLSQLDALREVVATPTPVGPSTSEETPRDAKSIATFMFGTFLGQVANNVGQVIMPLILFSFTDSPATVSLILTLTSVTNGIGSFLGGWLFGAMSQTRLLLLVTNVGRGVILGVCALFFVTGKLNLLTASVFFCTDYAVLGVIDTVRNAAPSSFVGRERVALEKFNTQYQIAFDLGTTVGPLMAGLVIQFWKFSVAVWIAPIAFVLVGINSVLISPGVKEEGSSATKNSPWASVQQIATSPVLASVFFLTLTQQMYRMKGLFSATCAALFSSNPDTVTAWLIATFGIGGLIGAFLFRVSKGLTESAFSYWSYVGLLVFAVSWIPGDIWFIAVCILFFSTTNVLSRLCFQAKLQSVIKQGASGGVMGLNRTGVKIITAIQQLAFALSFTLAEAVKEDTGGNGNTLALSFFGLFIVTLLLVSYFLFRTQEKYSNLQEADPEGASQPNGTEMKNLGQTPSSSTYLLSSLDTRNTAGLQKYSPEVPSKDGGLRRRVGAASSFDNAPPLMSKTFNPANSSPTDKKVHQNKGVFIVFEGVDGSGKSTQLDWIHDKLSAQGYDVVVTRWNSSSMLSQTIKKAKRAHKMTPITFSIMQAGDSAEQLKEVIIPALKQGKIVLSDRYFYTSLARDSVRGMNNSWLRSLFNFAINPDLVMYFKVPVATAISRVLKRRTEIKKEKRRKARARKEKSAISPSSVIPEYDSDEESGDQSDGEEAFVDIGEEDDKNEEVELNFYEAGLDCKLSGDPLENFNLFQSQVVDKYDSMVTEYGFKLIDATLTREQMFATVQSHVLKAVSGKTALIRCTHLDPLCLKQCGWFTDSADVNKKKDLCKSSKHPLPMFFRMVLLPMRARFSELFDLSDAPVVLLHGNPHVDNYARTNRGTAMIDFDRSCYGPYPFDLARFLVSLSIFQMPSNSGLFLPENVIEAFKEGYWKGLTQPHLRFLEMRTLQRKSIHQQPLTINDFLLSKKGWAKELYNNTIYYWEERHEEAPDSIKEMLNGYLESCNEKSLLKTYRIDRVGVAAGSFGLDRYLVLLSPIEGDSPLDRILLDIKSVIPCPARSDDGHYFNPFDHNGQRMIEASKLIAPGATQSEGYVTINGKEYYGRRIPPWKEKIKTHMTEEELVDLALAVGTQLGRGHKLSVGDARLKEVSKNLDLLVHFRLNFRAIVEAASTLRLELNTSYYRLLGASQLCI